GARRPLPGGRRGRGPAPEPGAHDLRGRALPPAGRDLSPATDPAAPAATHAGGAWSPDAPDHRRARRRLELVRHAGGDPRAERDPGRALPRDRPRSRNAHALAVRLGHPDPERVVGRRASGRVGGGPGPRRAPAAHGSVGVAAGLPGLHRDLPRGGHRPLRDRRAARRSAPGDGALRRGDPPAPARALTGASPAPPWPARPGASGAGLPPVGDASPPVALARPPRPRRGAGVVSAAGLPRSSTAASRAGARPHPLARPGARRDRALVPGPLSPIVSTRMGCDTVRSWTRAGGSG